MEATLDRAEDELATTLCIKADVGGLDQVKEVAGSSRNATGGVVPLIARPAAAAKGSCGVMKPRHFYGMVFMRVSIS